MNNVDNKRETIKKHLEKEVSLPQKIAIDTLGILLIIASGLFGWLPGPGGIPLLLAGLSLLATNHEWARKLLLKIKTKGLKIMDNIFVDHPIIVFIYDIIAIFLLIIAGLIFGKATGNTLRGVAIFLTFFSIGLFICNRKRIDAINRFITRLLKRSQKH